MAPLVSPLYLLQGAGMVLVAICAVWLWQRGKDSLWPAIWWGALAWTVSVAMKFAFAFSVRGVIHADPHNPLTWLCSGLVTGVFECTVPLMMISISRLDRADWNRAIAFGIGFGGTEAVLLGLVSFVPVLLVLVFPDQMPTETREALVRRWQGNGLLSIPLPIVERAATLLIHVLSSVLLILAVRMRQQRWFWESFAYKTAVDGFADWAIVAWKANDSLTKVAVVEAGAVSFAVIALAALPGLRASFARLDLAQVKSASPGWPQSSL